MATESRWLMRPMAILLCITVFPCAAMAAEWKKVGEDKGIAGYTRATPKSSIDEVMAVGIIDAPIQVVEAIIRDPNAGKKFMFMCKEAYSINTPDLQSTDDDVVYNYNITDLPFPVKDRDAVARVEYTIDKATGAIYSHAEGIKTDYRNTGKTVRMPLVTLDYKLVPKGADKTEVTYLAMADPGGNLPPALVNLLTRNIGIRTIANIRKLVQEDPYKNAPSVVTTTPTTSHPFMSMPGL